MPTPMVNTAVAITLTLVFAALSLWHFYMAFSVPSGESRAVPSIDGKPLFTPSKTATLIVSLVLFLFAMLVAATGKFVVLPVPQTLLTWASYALALGLFARAIGDFKYVGFFKSVRGTPFARMDTRVYSPLCALLSIGVAANAILHNP
ncbi:MAG: DUF3995 domain-containing protein [Betaproteobacteria bacterium]